MRGAIIMVDEEFKEKVLEEAKTSREKQIRELESISNRTEMQEYMLNFFKKQDLKSRTDKEILRDIYYRLIDIFDFYIDDKFENQIIDSLWVIGANNHSFFNTFPYLYINAMRGSAKSRKLKLLASLCKGKWITSPTEAILFRTNYMLSLDEMESINDKEKGNIRDILNAAYKKGLTIPRMRRKKGIDGERQVIEEFEVYRPISIANINGMDEVLGDRCIWEILEKSNNPSKTKLSEDFDNDKNIIDVLTLMYWCRLRSVGLLPEHVYQQWNAYIKHKYEPTFPTYSTLPTLPTLPTLQQLFNKIDESGLFGRNLELFFPLFLIASYIGDDVLLNIITIAKKISEEKRHDEETESLDVLIYDFVSKFESNLEFHPIRELLNEFKNRYHVYDDKLNNERFGKILRKLNLFTQKSRDHYGIKVILNVAKAKEKRKIFEVNEENVKD